jgi:SAM-dependent methyltransferase
MTDYMCQKEKENTETANKTSYESIAENYLRTGGEKSFVKYYERPNMLKLLPAELTEKNVLDLGCASGFYSKYCLDNGAVVTAVDASAKMIHHTAEVCGNNPFLQTYVHDISRPFTFLQDSSFDLIICSLVLHYIEDWNPVLAEFGRILRPGGKCLISAHHPINDYTLFNEDSYLEKKLIDDVWKGFDPPLEVSYYVRPLKEYIQPILDSTLKLVRLVEPEPAEELKERNYSMYLRLNNEPTFVFYVLENAE